jgi:hypothetical protein
VPTKLFEGDIRYGTANYKVIGLNCVVGKHATFRLQPLSRTKDIVIPLTLKYGNQSRTFSYTILAEEAAPASPVVAAQPVALESTPVPVPGYSNHGNYWDFGVSNKALQSTRKIEKFL